MKGRDSDKQGMFPLYNTDVDLIQNHHTWYIFDTVPMKHSCLRMVNSGKMKIMQVLVQIIWVHWLRNSKCNKSLVALKTGPLALTSLQLFNIWNK